MKSSINAHFSLLKLTMCMLAFISFCSCEMCYDPSIQDDTASAPGTTANQKFTYREKVAAPYTEEDLTNTMPLSKLLDIALYNNPTTRASWYTARAAAYAYHVTLSNYYPTLGFNGSFQDQISNGAASISSSDGTIFSSPTRGGGTQNVVSVFNQLTLSYLVLDFGGRYGTSELAFQTLVATNWQHNLAVQQVMLSVITYYTSYIGNKALVAANEQDLKDAQVALDAALKMRNSGLATLTDVLSAQSALEQTRYNLAQAIGAEKTAKGELLIALGLPNSICLCVEDLPDQLPVICISGDVCKLIDLAKQNRPDIGAAIAQVKEQEANLLISVSSGLPTLTLAGSASRVGFFKPDIHSVFNDSFSVNWSGPIFAGFYYVNQQKQYQAQIAEAIANLDVTVAQVVTNVVVNYYAFTTADAALPSTEALVKYSDRAYRGMLSQYKVGTSSITDVLSALTTLSNARAQNIMTRTQWASSLANLAFAVGVLEDDGGTWFDNPPENLNKPDAENDCSNQE